MLFKRRTSCFSSFAGFNSRYPYFKNFTFSRQDTSVLKTPLNVTILVSKSIYVWFKVHVFLNVLPDLILIFITALKLYSKSKSLIIDYTIHVAFFLTF